MKSNRPKPPRVHRKWQSILKPHTDLIASLRPGNTYQEIADIIKEETEGKIVVTRSTVYKFCKNRNLNNGNGTFTKNSPPKKAPITKGGNYAAIEEAKRNISAQLVESENQNKASDELEILTPDEVRRLQ